MLFFDAPEKISKCDILNEKLLLYDRERGVLLCQRSKNHMGEPDAGVDCISDCMCLQMAAGNPPLQKNKEDKK